MFNLAVDEEHVTLAFGLRWIEAISRHYERVDVVTMRTGAYSLPSNVRVWSVGQELGFSKLRRALRFYAIVVRILRERPISVVFTHMIPIFAVLFWPLARIARLHNVLWYAHGATPPTLRLAHRLVDRVVSSTPEGFRLPSDKIVFLGQGVETNIYKPAVRRSGEILRVVTVGRIAPSKGIDLLIEALVECGKNLNYHLTIVGAPTTESEKVYANTLQRHVDGLPLRHRIDFVGRKSAKEIALLLATCDVFVNLGTTGSLDKAIVEAMASGCPVISSNDAFARIARENGFPHCAIERSAQAVCSALSALAAMPAFLRQELADRQSQVAYRDHTLDGLITRLCKILDAETKQTACSR